jgi:hypothetical protein
MNETMNFSVMKTVLTQLGFVRNKFENKMISENIANQTIKQ